jgi:site-specific DNA-methyltransferase (adenine-specific)
VNTNSKGVKLDFTAATPSVVSRSVGENETGILPFDTVIVGDSTEAIRALPSASIHLILSDIPYGIGAEDWDVLHDNTNSAFLGSSPAQMKAGAIFRKRGKPINGWSEADRAIPQQYYNWCSVWASEWLRILKPGGTAFVFAGRRYAHRCICALEDAGFSFKDMIGWLRERAPHRAQRLSVVYDRRGDRASSEDWEGWRVGNLRPSFEPILWFTKPYKIGTTIADNALSHGVGPFNEEEFLRYAHRPDNLLDCGFEPGEAGLHPTQKPVQLMQALIALTTKPGQVVLDPFAGSGSTAVAARNLGRHFIAYDISEEYVETCRKRLENRLLPFTP